MTYGDTVVIGGVVDLNAEIDGELGEVTVVETGGATLRPATRTTLGGVIVGEDLQITQGGVLSVIKADKAEQDNTRPITSVTTPGSISSRPPITHRIRSYQGI